MNAPVVHHGGCIEVMRGMADNSIDAIVTDPPYSLSFMGRTWDTHETPLGFQEWCETWATEALRILKPGGFMASFGGTRTFHRLAVGIEDAGFQVRDSIGYGHSLLAWVHGQGFPKGKNALKPAWEPIVLARKPLAKGMTVAANVIAHGTGALNIDGCRIEGVPPSVPQPKFSRDMVAGFGASDGRSGVMSAASGRWPANVALSEDQAAALDQMSGTLHSQDPATRKGSRAGSMAFGERVPGANYADKGGASRFMYVAKASAKERPKVDGIAHPTVKPLALMRWLIRLVTPPGGTILDPFAGSGTTIEAAMLEGFDVIGIEREADYLPLIQARIDRNTYEAPDDLYGMTPALFDDDGEATA